MPNGDEERTKRQRWTAGAGVALLLLIGMATLGFLLYLANTEDSRLSALTVLFALLTIVLAFASVTYSVFSLIVASNSIFPGSGKPIEMAKTLYESGFLQAQMLLGIFVVGIVCVLLSASLIQPSEGLPVITFATGFALARQYPHRKDPRPPDPPA